VGNIVEAMASYATGRLGPIAIPLSQVDRMIVIGSDRMMAAGARARKSTLAAPLKPDPVGIAAVNPPLPCMMKAARAPCPQKHVDPATGREEIVFSCFNQDQKLDEMDWGNLAARLRQNTVSEKLTNLWMDRLFRMEDPRVV